MKTFDERKSEIKSRLAARNKSKYSVKKRGKKVVVKRVKEKG